MSSNLVVTDHNKQPILCSVGSGNLHQFDLKSQLVSHNRDKEFRQLDDRRGNSNGDAPQVPLLPQHQQPQDVCHGNPNTQMLDCSIPNNYVVPPTQTQQVQNVTHNIRVNPMVFSQPPNFLPQVCPPFNAPIAFTWISQHVEWFRTAIAYFEQSTSHAGTSHTETTRASSVLGGTVPRNDSSDEVVPADHMTSDQMALPREIKTEDILVVDKPSEAIIYGNEKNERAVQETSPEVTLRIVAENVAEPNAPAAPSASEGVKQDATPIVEVEDEVNPETPLQPVVQISSKSIARALRKERQKLREAQQSVVDLEAKPVPAPIVSSRNAKKRAQKERRKNKDVSKAPENEKDPFSNENDSNSLNGATKSPELGLPQLQPSPPIEPKKKENKGKEDDSASNLATNNGSQSDAVKPTNCQARTVENPEVENQESYRENLLEVDIVSASASVTKKTKKRKKKSKKSSSSVKNHTDRAVFIPELEVSSAQACVIGLPSELAAEKAEEKNKKCSGAITAKLPKIPEEASKPSEIQVPMFVVSDASIENTTRIPLVSRKATTHDSVSEETEKKMNNGTMGHVDQSNSTEFTSRPQQVVNAPETQELDSIFPDHGVESETVLVATRATNDGNTDFPPNVDPHGISISSEVSQLEYSVSHEPNGSDSDVLFVSMKCTPENEIPLNRSIPGREPIANVRTNKDEVDDVVSRTTPVETSVPLNVSLNFDPVLHDMASEITMRLQFEELKKKADLKKYYKTTWKPDKILNDMAMKVIVYYIVMLPVRSNYSHLRPKDYNDPNLEEPTGLLKEIVDHTLKKPLFFWKNETNLKRCQKYIEDRINDYKGATDPTKKKLHALYKMVSLTLQPHFNLEDIMYFCSKPSSRAEKRKMDEKYLEMFEHAIRKHLRKEYKSDIFAEEEYRKNPMFAFLQPTQFLHLQKYLKTMFQLRTGLYTAQQKIEMIESLTPSQRKMFELGEKIQSQCEWSSEQTIEFLEKLADSIYCNMYGAQQFQSGYYPQQRRYQQGGGGMNNGAQQQQPFFQPQHGPPQSQFTAPASGLNPNFGSSGYPMESYQPNQTIYELPPQAVGVPMNQSHNLPPLPAPPPQMASQNQAPGDEIVFAFNVPFIPQLAMTWVSRYPEFFEEALSKLRSGPPPPRTQNQHNDKLQKQTNDPSAESVEPGQTNGLSFKATEQVSVEVPTNVNKCQQIENVSNDVVENESTGPETELPYIPPIVGEANNQSDSAITVLEFTKHNTDASTLEKEFTSEHNSLPLIPQIERSCSVDASSEVASEEPESIVPDATPIQPTEQDDTRLVEAVDTPNQLASASSFVAISRKSIARASRRERQKIREALKAGEQDANSGIKQYTPAFENIRSSEKKIKKTKKKKTEEKKARDSISDGAVDAQSQSSSFVSQSRLERRVRGPEDVDVTGDSTGKARLPTKISKMKKRTLKKNERETKRREKEKPANLDSKPSSYKNRGAIGDTLDLPNRTHSEPGPKFDITKALLAALAKRCKSQRPQKSDVVSNSQNDMKPDDSCFNTVSMQQKGESDSSGENSPRVKTTNEASSLQDLAVSEPVKDTARDHTDISFTEDEVNGVLLHLYTECGLDLKGNDVGWEDAMLYKMLFTKCYLYINAMTLVRMPCAVFRLKTLPSSQFNYDKTGLLRKIMEFQRMNPMRRWRNEATEQTFKSFVEERLETYKRASNPTDQKLLHFFKILLNYPEGYLFWDDVMYLSSQPQNTTSERAKLDIDYFNMFENTVLKHMFNQHPLEQLGLSDLPSNIRSLIEPEHFENLQRYLRNMYELRYNAATPTQRLNLKSSLPKPQQGIVNFFESCEKEIINWGPDHTEKMLKGLLESVLRMEKSEESLKFIRLYKFLLQIESTILDGDCYAWSVRLEGLKSSAFTLKTNRNLLTPWFFS
ncbi:unnamed protein product [Caenorhabditis brenneri]